LAELEGFGKAAEATELREVRKADEVHEAGD